MKLAIEIMGSMFQDWDNEVFRWDMDNILKIRLDGKLMYSGECKNLINEVETNDSFDAAISTIEQERHYSYVSAKSSAFQTTEGNTEHLTYAYCNLKATGETTIKYGKFHLKKEIDVADDFKFSDLIFVRLDNLANAVQSGEPYFASLICCVGHGEINLKIVASNIKDEEECRIR